MGQLTLYLPDAMAKRLRAQAKRAKKSLSAFVADLLDQRPRDSQWPPGFAELYGSCPDLKEPADLPPDEVAPL